jgi:outer membrane lipoprotein carrier protein
MFRFFIFLFLFFSFPAYASPPLSETLQTTYEATSDWNAHFTQFTFVELLGKDIHKSGQITIQKPGKWRLEYTDIPQKTYVSNGKKLWVYTEGDQEVAVYPQISDLMATEALVFLGGLGRLNESFATSTRPNQKADFTAKDLKKLELEPKNPDSSLKAIVLGLHPKTNLITEMFLFNESGNRTHYIFENIELNTQPPAEMFVFKKAGVKEVKN